MKKIWYINKLIKNITLNIENSTLKHGDGKTLIWNVNNVIIKLYLNKI